jgi:hypothetical protein
MESKKTLTKAEAIKQGKASVNLDHTSKAKQHVVDGEKDKSMLLTQVPLTRIFSYPNFCTSYSVFLYEMPRAINVLTIM